MPSRLSIQQISDYTGFTWKTCDLRLKDLPFEKQGMAKLYNSADALRNIYRSDPKGDGGMSNAEAASLLAQARTKESEIKTEILRKKRIDLESIEQVNEEVMTNLASMLKGQINKTFTEATLQELLAELRSLGSKMKERGTVKPEQEITLEHDML